MPRYEEEKQKLFQDLSSRYANPTKEYERKLSRYDKIWDRAELIADYFFSNSKTNKSTQEIVKDLVEEFYSYKGSILKSFRNLKTRTFGENVERAKQLRVKGRLKEFLKAHGTETFEYNGKTKTLEQWVKYYLDNKISTKELFDIIKWWQDTNPDYDANMYRKSDSSSAILSDKFE